MEGTFADVLQVDCCCTVTQRHGQVCRFLLAAIGYEDLRPKQLFGGKD